MHSLLFLAICSRPPHGHAFGDRVLQAIAAILPSVFRRSDVVCRYGGKAFPIVLPEASIASATQRVDALMGAVRAHAQEYQGERLPGISVSIGLEGFPGHGADAGSLLAAADAALYVAKNAGRDRMQAAAAP